MKEVQATSKFGSHLARALQHSIRSAKEPNNPSLINYWLEVDQCKTGATFEQKRDHHERQFRLLLDTIADELLPGHWRCCCLDNIYRPLLELENLSSHPAYRRYTSKLRYELNMTCNYVLAGLSH